jgi:hypothetical protein
MPRGRPGKTSGVKPHLEPRPPQLRTQRLIRLGGRDVALDVLRVCGWPVAVRGHPQQREQQAHAANTMRMTPMVWMLKL